MAYDGDLFGNPISLPRTTRSRRPPAPPPPPPPRREEPPPRPPEPGNFAVHRASARWGAILVISTFVLIIVQALRGVRFTKTPIIEFDIAGVGKDTIVGVMALVVVGIGFLYFAEVFAAAFANIGWNARRKSEVIETTPRRAAFARTRTFVITLAICLACLWVPMRYDYWLMSPVVKSIYAWLANPPRSPFDKQALKKPAPPPLEKTLLEQLDEWLTANTKPPQGDAWPRR